MTRCPSCGSHDTTLEKGPGIYSLRCHSCGLESAGTWVGPELFEPPAGQRSPEPDAEPMTLVAHLRDARQLEAIRAALGPLYAILLRAERLEGGVGALEFEITEREEELALKRLFARLDVGYD